VLVLDIDSVIKIAATLIHDGLSERKTSIVVRNCARSFEARELPSFFVASINIVVQVEIECRHGELNNVMAAELLRCCFAIRLSGRDGSKADLRFGPRRCPFLYQDGRRNRDEQEFHEPAGGVSGSYKRVDFDE